MTNGGGLKSSPAKKQKKKKRGKRRGLVITKSLGRFAADEGRRKEGSKSAISRGREVGKGRGEKHLSTHHWMILPIYDLYDQEKREKRRSDPRSFVKGEGKKKKKILFTIPLNRLPLLSQKGREG